MSKLSDFTIENGLCRGADAPADGPGTPCVILRAYHGPGGNVVVPDGVTGIFERAFAHNETIRTVHLPESVKTIGSKAFDGCAKLVIHAPAGSKIIRYAEKNAIPYVAE